MSIAANCIGNTTTPHNHTIQRGEHMPTFPIGSSSSAYHAWRHAHPAGMVVRQKGRADYMVHKATCPRINEVYTVRGNSSAGNQTNDHTSRTAKLCFDNHALAQAEFPDAPSCKTCMGKYT
jgi:hypothetical protein